MITIQKCQEIAFKTALSNISMKSPDHLKEWLGESGRRWLIFDGLDLVDALDFPAGIRSLMEIINQYQAFRGTKMSGRVETFKHPITGDVVERPLPKDSVLEVEEIDRAIRYLVGLISAKDENWSLNNPPM